MLTFELTLVLTNVNACPVALQINIVLCPRSLIGAAEKTQEHAGFM